MPYEPETFRPRRPVKASRGATAEEIQGFVLETLRWMPCAVTVEQIAEKAREDWAGISYPSVRAALKKLAAEGQVKDTSGGSGRLWVGVKYQALG